MAGNRNEKIEKALREAAAEYLAREANPQSLITVTRVGLSDDAKRAVIYFTVLPEEQERAALGFAERHVADLADFFRKRVRGVFPPRMQFQIDRGEKNRQRLDELSQ